MASANDKYKTGDKFYFTDADGNHHETNLEGRDLLSGMTEVEPRRFADADGNVYRVPEWEIEEFTRNNIAEGRKVSPQFRMRQGGGNIGDALSGNVGANDVWVSDYDKVRVQELKDRGWQRVEGEGDMTALEAAFSPKTYAEFYSDGENLKDLPENIARGVTGAAVATGTGAVKNILGLSASALAFGMDVVGAKEGAKELRRSKSIVDEMAGKVLDWNTDNILGEAFFNEADGTREMVNSGLKAAEELGGLYGLGTVVRGGGKLVAAGASALKPVEASGRVAGALVRSGEIAGGSSRTAAVLDKMSEAGTAGKVAMATVMGAQGYEDTLGAAEADGKDASDLRVRTAAAINGAAAAATAPLFGKLTGIVGKDEAKRVIMRSYGHMLKMAGLDTIEGALLGGATGVAGETADVILGGKADIEERAKRVFTSMAVGGGLVLGTKVPGALGGWVKQNRQRYAAAAAYQGREALETVGRGMPLTKSEVNLPDVKAVTVNGEVVFNDGSIYRPGRGERTLQLGGGLTRTVAAEQATVKLADGTVLDMNGRVVSVAPGKLTAHGARGEAQTPAEVVYRETDPDAANKLRIVDPATGETVDVAEINKLQAPESVRNWFAAKAEGRELPQLDADGWAYMSLYQQSAGMNPQISQAAQLALEQVRLGKMTYRQAAELVDNAITTTMGKNPSTTSIYGFRKTQGPIDPNVPTADDAVEVSAREVRTDLPALGFVPDAPRADGALPRSTVTAAERLIGYVKDGTIAPQTVDVTALPITVRMNGADPVLTMLDAAADSPVVIVRQADDGTMTVLTGQNTVEKARISGVKTIEAVTVREEDGWDVESARAISALAGLEAGGMSLSEAVAMVRRLGLSREDVQEVAGNLPDGRPELVKSAVDIAERISPVVADRLTEENVAPIAALSEGANMRTLGLGWENVQEGLVTAMPDFADAAQAKVAGIVAANMPGVEPVRAWQIAEWVAAHAEDGAVVDALSGGADGIRAIERMMAGDAAGTTPVEEPDGSFKTVNEIEAEAGGSAIENIVEPAVDKSLELSPVKDRPGTFGIARFPRVRVTAVTNEGGKFWVVEGLTAPEMLDGRNRYEMGKFLSELADRAAAAGIEIDLGDGALVEIANELVANYGEENRAKIMLARQNAVTDVLKKSHLADDVVSDPEKFNEMLMTFPEGERFVKDGKTWGFYNPADNKIYLNAALFGTQTGLNVTIHEFAHPAVIATRKANPELYNRGMELVGETDFYREVSEHPDYRDRSERHRREEALVRLLTSRLEDIKANVPAKIYKEIEEFVNQFWRRFGEANGIRDLTPAMVQTMTVEDIADAIGAEMMSGRPFGENGAENAAAEMGEVPFARALIGGRETAVSTGYPLSIRDARNPEKVLELLSPIVGKSAAQLGEMKLTRIDTASIEHLLNSKAARWDKEGISRDAKRLWRGRVGGLSVLDDIIATSNLGVEEFAKHHNKDWKKGAKFYRANTRFAIEVKNGYEIYPCQLIVAEMKNGERYVYDLVEIKKPTLSASAGNANLNMTLGSTRTGESVASSGSISQIGVSAQEDAAYLDAVKRGDMETAQKLLKVAWERNGYSQLRNHLDAHAAPSAPVEAENFRNVEALMEAREEGWDLNLWAIAKGISGQPNDFFSEQGPRLYMYDDKAGIEAQKEIAKAISMIQAGLNTRINVYRAVPKNIKSDFLQSGGEWVSPSKTYAENHGKFRFGEGEYRIIERLVPAEHLWWDGSDAREWGYDDGRQYVYANTENGSKLATVTYDDAGNVIPLSQRFNQQKADIRFARGGAERSVFVAGRARVAEDAGAGERTPSAIAASKELSRAVPTALSQAGQNRYISLPLSELEWLRKRLTGNAAPAHLAERLYGGKNAAHTRAGKLVIAADIFGSVDKTDMAEIKDALKAAGYFRDEDPAWCLTQNAADVRAEHERSESKLADELIARSERRIAGREAGGHAAARGIYADELAKIVMNLPSGQAAPGTIGKVKTIADALMRRVSGLANQADQADYFLDWAQGGSPEAPRTDEERAAQMFGAFMVMPLEMHSRANGWFTSIVGTIVSDPKLNQAWRSLSLRSTGARQSADAVAEQILRSVNRSSELAIHAMQEEGRAPIPAGDWKARMKESFFVAFDDKLGCVVARVDDRVRAYRRAKKEVMKKARTPQEKAALQAEIDRFMGEAAKNLNQFELSRTAYERGAFNEGLRYLYRMRELEDRATITWKLSEDDKLLYLNFRRVIETDGRSGSFGISPRQAQIELDAMEKKLGPERWAHLVEYGKEFHAIIEQEVLDDPRVTQMFGKDFVDYCRTQTNYVTTKRTFSPEELEQIEITREAVRQRGVHGGDDVITQMFTYGQRSGGIDKNENLATQRLKGSMAAAADQRAATWEKHQAIMQAVRRNAMVIDLKRLLIEAGVTGVSDHRRGTAGFPDNRRYGHLNYMLNGQKRTLVVPREIADGFDRDAEAIRLLTAINNFARNGYIDWNIGFRLLANPVYDQSSFYWKMPGTREPIAQSVARAVVPGGDALFAVVTQWMVRKIPVTGKLFGPHSFQAHLPKAQAIVDYLRKPHEWSAKMAKAEARGDTAAMADLLQLRDEALEVLRANMFLPTGSNFQHGKSEGFAADVMSAKGMKTAAQIAESEAAMTTRQKLVRAVNIFKKNAAAEEGDDMVAKVDAFLHDQKEFGNVRTVQESGALVKKNVATPEFDRKGKATKGIQSSLFQFFNVSIKNYFALGRAARNIPGQVAARAANVGNGRIISGMLTVGVAAVAMLKAAGGDEEKARKRFGIFFDWANFVYKAAKNFSKYTRENYAAIPIWLSKNGYTTISIAGALSSEDKFVTPWADYLVQKLASDVYGIAAEPSLAETAARATIKNVVPDLQLSAPAFKIINDAVVSHWENPTDFFTGRKTYDNDVWAMRGESLGDYGRFAGHVGMRLWNDLGGRALWQLDMQGENVHDETPETVTRVLRWIPAVSPALSRFIKIQVGSPEKHGEAIEAADDKMQMLTRTLAKRMLSMEKDNIPVWRADPEKYEATLDDWQKRYGFSDWTRAKIEAKYINASNARSYYEYQDQKKLNSLRKKAYQLGFDDAEVDLMLGEE
ncbi:MAG: hypothetical protein IKC80_00385 [Kiritimatiellae bacterium]|nr:hypothetical protein [Kiritimatiellia bacterium]